MWTKIDCNSSLSMEDILRLVLLNNGTDNAVRVILV
jgi:hypothetical protein